MSNDVLGRAVSGAKRFSLRMFLIVGLSVVHGWATFDGMRELVPEAGIKLDDWSTFIKPAGLSLIAVVSMLTAMIVFTLHVMFSDATSRMVRSATILVYLFLEVVSIGLGFGFYYKVLNSANAAFSDVGAVEAFVDRQFTNINREIASAGAVLTSAAKYSRDTAEKEKKGGGTCPGVSSKSGCGDICKLRISDADTIEGWNGQVSGRLTTLSQDISNLKSRATQATKSIRESKQDVAMTAIVGLNSQIISVTDSINRLSKDAQIQGIAKQMQERAARTSHQSSDKKGRPFACPDGTLTGHLNRAAAALSGLPQITKPPQVPTNIGSEATKSAFTRLLSSVKYALSGDFAIAKNSGIDQATGQAFSGDDRLNQNDLLALVIAIAVDIGLLYVSAYKYREPTRTKLIDFFDRFDSMQDDAGLGWRVFDRVHLRTFHGHYLAIPDTDKQPELAHLNKFLDMLHGYGEISRSLFMTTDRVKNIYKRRGSELEQYDRFNVYRVSKEKLAQMFEVAEKRVRDKSGSFTPPKTTLSDWEKAIAGIEAPQSSMALEYQRPNGHERTDRHDWNGRSDPYARPDTQDDYRGNASARDPGQNGAANYGAGGTQSGRDYNDSRRDDPVAARPSHPSRTPDTVFSADESDRANTAPSRPHRAEPDRLRDPNTTVLSEEAGPDTGKRTR